ncbi:MAG: class I SAM-dependent methyltransferase [Candidatus Omnitrophica bacterium]|nr:class I SAM-dependent methyltransferase [Candidatus Omnitrophota bacterium]
MSVEIKKWIEKDGEKFIKSIGIKKGQTVLDFGCGEGHYTVPVARVVGEKGKAYALDKDKQALDKLMQLAKERDINNIEFINKNSKAPLEDNSIDVVLCYDVIHYGNRKERRIIYNEVYRVLKKKGLFSVYPKHHKEDYPLMELADVNLEKVIKEIEELGFVLEYKFLKRLLHDKYYNDGYVLNFRR